MKSGIHGISKHMGTGNYQLSNLWFNVPLSQILFRLLGVNYSAFSILLLPLPFIPFSQRFYPTASPLLFLFFLLFSSPITQSIAFVTLADIITLLGFFFVFLFLHLMKETDHSIFIVSTRNFSLQFTTVLFIAIIASISLLGDSNWQFLFITMIPCLAYIGAHILYVFIRSKKISYKYLLNTFKGIGAIKKKAKYAETLLHFIKYRQIPNNLLYGLLFFLFVLHPEPTLTLLPSISNFDHKFETFKVF